MPIFILRHEQAEVVGDRAQVGVVSGDDGLEPGIEVVGRPSRSRPKHGFSPAVALAGQESGIMIAIVAAEPGLQARGRRAGPGGLLAFPNLG